MGDAFAPGAAVPFPNRLVVDQARSPDFNLLSDDFSQRASATNLMDQSSGSRVPSRRPHSLRWLDVSPHASSPPVRFSSIASVTTFASSVHRSDDPYSTRAGTAPPIQYDSPFPPEVYYDYRGMPAQHTSSVSAPQRSVLRLVGRPFSRKRSADLESAVSLPSSPVTPNTPAFAPSPTIVDFSNPFLEDGLYSEITQLTAGDISSNVGKSLLGDHLRLPSRLRPKSRDLRPEPEQVISFNPGVDLTPQQLQRAQNLDVLDQEGKKIRFGDLWQAQQTCVVFIRHFLCPFCTDYMRSITEQVDPDALDKAGVNLVVIGNGSHAMIKSYRNIFNFPFLVYTDPSRAVYRALGMTLRTTNSGPDVERGEYIEHGVASGVAMVMKNAVRVRMPLHRNSGDVKQLGGEFVLGPGLRCSYASRMHNTRSHAPVRDMLTAAGVQLDLRSDTQSEVYFDAEDQWMRDRDAELKRMRARKGRRRGFVGEHRRSESSDFDTGPTDVCLMPHWTGGEYGLEHIAERPDCF